MTVLRIVADFAASNPQMQAQFYSDLFGLEVAMDQGFIVTLIADVPCRPQLSLMTEGGSGSPVPALSIEVDDVRATYQNAEAMGAEIVYPLTEEPWGVRRFFVRDTADRIINVLQHIG